MNTQTNAPAIPAGFFNPSIEDYIHLLPNGATVQLTLTCEEACAIFLAYDNGIAGLNAQAAKQLENAIASVKQALWK